MAKSWDKIIEEVAQQLYKGLLKGNISAAMVRKQAAKLMDAVIFGFDDAGTITEGDQLQIESLQNNVYVFSGFKNYQQLKECSQLLLDDKGNIRPFADFLKDVRLIDNTYNIQYLDAEYQHAQASSMMISKWNEIKAQADVLPFLQYDAIMDDRVREEHAMLNGKVKRWDDPFWKTYYPPNGWNCRCEVRQLADATEDTLIDLPVIPPMFRNNVGIDGIVFPDTHPYYNAPKEVAQVITKESKALIPKKKNAS